MLSSFCWPRPRCHHPSPRHPSPHPPRHRPRPRPRHHHRHRHRPPRRPPPPELSSPELSAGLSAGRFAGLSLELSPGPSPEPSPPGLSPPHPPNLRPNRLPPRPKRLSSSISIDHRKTDRVIFQRTLEEISPPRLGSLNAVPKEVIALPKIRVRNLVRHELLHGGPEFGILVQIAADIRRFLVDVKLLGPGLKLSAGTVLGKTLE